MEKVMCSENSLLHNIKCHPEAMLAAKNYLASILPTLKKDLKIKLNGTKSTQPTYTLHHRNSIHYLFLDDMS